jgi:eukaryotic-like serine/threonine-protein kinase
MSPEQARGDDIDARSGLFSAGSVLNELVSRQLPFPGKTSAVVFDAILNREPLPLVKLNSRVPEELQRIIGKGLEKDRDVRYQSATELRSDLKRLKRDSASGRAQVATPRGSGAAPSATGTCRSSRATALLTTLTQRSLMPPGTAEYMWIGWTTNMSCRSKVPLEFDSST